MSDTIFNLPKHIIIEKNEKNYATFSFKPLEKGYGITIGNALRRVLLSSLEGYAVTHCSIPNIHHEFSTIDGVIEDVSEIILNLKKVRVKALESFIQEDVNICLKERDELKAADIAKNNKKVAVLNPELTLCRFAKPLQFDISLIIKQGKGYALAEEHDLTEDKSAILGIMALDAIFTPIKKVSYKVEDTRVGRKIDYDNLLLSIETDGTITPEDALKHAIKILIKHFELFLTENFFIYPSMQDEEKNTQMLQLKKILKTPLNELNLTSRAFNSLASAGLSTLGDIVIRKEDELNFKNFGKKSHEEIKNVLEEYKLHFGMDVKNIVLSK